MYEEGGEFVMKRKLLSLFIIMTIVFTIPVCAASTRAYSVVPDITFSGTEADCTVRITANSISDKVVGTMELWQGTTMIDSWNGSGIYTLKLNGTAKVNKNKTYTLKVEYSVNGVTQTPVKISKTNR